MTSTSVQAAVPAPPIGRSGQGVRAAAVLGTAVVVLGTLSILALHVIPPTSAISPLRRTISEYAYSGLGWVFNTGVIAIAVGSLLITASSWTSQVLRPKSMGTVAVIAWSVALVVLVIYPKHDWSVGPSSHGSIHRVASLVAFVSIPIAVIVIGRGRSGRLRTPGRLSMLFGTIAAGWLATLVGGFVVGPLTHTPWWLVFPLGLMERGMALFAVAGVIAVGWLAIRGATPAQAPQTVRRRNSLRKTPRGSK